MRLVTPEIAWHETLPIYSCDLQSSQDYLGGSGNDRPPLADVTPFLHPGTPCLDSVLLQRRGQTDALPGWTRLATAGGDNVVRLWRVRLGWVSAANSSNLDDSISASGGVAKGKKAAAAALAATLVEQLTYLASLKRHEKPVNVVRWSPNGQYLASGGDDLYIVIWSRQECTPATPQLFDQGHESTTTGNKTPASVDFRDVGDAEEEEDVTVVTERWLPCRSLRRHLEDIYDLCWSPDGRSLISGSVDHSVIVWQLNLVQSDQGVANDFLTGTGASPSLVDAPAPSVPSSNTNTGNRQLIIRDHKHYVQGVTWDPLGYYMVSMSNDRTCRVYKAGTRHCLIHMVKMGKQRLFQDDSWKSFFRRPAFSPDGALLVCPAGNLEGAPSADASLTTASSIDQGGSVATAPQHAAHVFLRTNLSLPVISLPTGGHPVVAVRFCPQPFQLRRSPVVDQTRTNLFDLPYRWLFCLVLEDSLLFYDTQQTKPFAMVSQFHYQALNDATWSKDGHLVTVCSTDGYCSLIHFARGELGAPYRGPVGSAAATGPRNQTGNTTTSAAPSSPTPATPSGLSEAAAAEIGGRSEQVCPSPRVAQPVTPVPGLAECGITSSEEAPSTNDGALSIRSSRRVSLVTLSTKPGASPGSGAPIGKTSHSFSTGSSASNSRDAAATSVLIDLTGSEKLVNLTAGSSSGQKRRVSFVTLDRKGSTSTG